MAQFALIHKENRDTILGSDQYIPLDGRLNIFNAIYQAKKQARTLKGIRSDIYSIRIYKGDLRNYFAISGYHIL